VLWGFINHTDGTIVTNTFTVQYDESVYPDTLKKAWLRADDVLEAVNGQRLSLGCLLRGRPDRDLSFVRTNQCARREIGEARDISQEWGFRQIGLLRNPLPAVHGVRPPNSGVILCCQTRETT
jgi:hypothetical protein